MKDSGSRACPAIVCGVCLFSVSYDLLASLNELSSACDGCINTFLPWCKNKTAYWRVKQPRWVIMHSTLQPAAQIKTVHVSVFACMCT